MKSILAGLAVLVGLVLADEVAASGVLHRRQRRQPQSQLLQQQKKDHRPEEYVPIVRSAADGPNPDGSYAFSFEAGNGIVVEERGLLRTEGETAINSVEGSYSYRSDDGTPISLSYVASDRGFLPKGDHLPRVPEIPEGILRALEWIANHPEEDNLRK